MKKNLFFILCCLLFACKQEPKPPAGIMPPQKMQTVLWELIKADEVVNHYAADPAQNRYAISIDLYKKVFEQQSITKEAFNKSMQWYSLHPQILKPMLDSMQRKHKPAVN